MKQKRILLLFLVALLSSLVGLGLVEFGGRKLASNVVGVEENFYLKYYYSYHNHWLLNRRKHSDNKNTKRAFPKSDTRLRIYDVSTCRTRADVAKVLLALDSLGAKSIALDIFYSDNPDVKDSLNDILVAAIDSIRPKLIIPSFNGNYPFFYDQIDSIKYVSPLRHNYFDDMKTADSLMSVAIAKHFLGKEDLGIKEGMKVNYLSKQFRILDNTSDLSRLVKGKIVLVGDLSDSKDFISTPFMIENYNQNFPGVMNIAYTVNTMLNTGNEHDDDIQKYANYPLQGISNWFTLLLAFILCFIYALIYDFISTDRKLALVSHGRIVLLLQSSIFLLFEFLVVIVCFLFTRYLNVIPDVIAFLTSVVCVTFFYGFMSTFKFFRI